jgi:hypothetical protein
LLRGPISDNEPSTLKRKPSTLKRTPTKMTAGTFASVTLRGPVPDDDVLDDMADTLRDIVKGAGLQIKGGPLICQILPTVETEVMFQTGGEGESSEQ